MHTVSAKDIPDEAMLAVIRACKPWATIVDLEKAFPQFPEKVRLAKADKLIRRGLITGCACGCRGGFEVR